MSDIRYVCLSDLHFGADNSILTAIEPGSIATDPSRPSAVLSQFALCLRELVAPITGSKKPTLILNGDILELALTDVDKAAMVFERFIELVFPPDGEALFNTDILYIPGNHDHHIWESARETEYLRAIGRSRPGDALPAPTHTTRMISPNIVPEPFLTNLLHVYPHLRDATVSVAYPTYALLSDDGHKSIIISHGHYVEAIYSLMTTLNTILFPDRKRPTVIEEVEAENFAWIDFLWSTLGRSGDVGEHIGLLYAKMQDNKQMSKLTTNLVRAWVARTIPTRPLQSVEAAQLEWVVNALLNKARPLERLQTEHLLSKDATRGLQWFVQDVVRDQMLREHDQTIPSASTFLFGHTHKPFQREMTFTGYHHPLKVYNSGGWVVDTVNISPVHGAAVLLIDDALDTVSVRMYNQAASPRDYAVRVEAPSSPGMAQSAFFRQVNAAVANGRDPWKTFSGVVAEAVGAYAQLLRAKSTM
jgi:UDP-2,3-diacylglucosamine pyrophosphatase LpxH